ncbi:hypothetical protein [Arcobacter arenosus]|uniref:hypothetical protein n=1 Tax=Arcobacter arenosus TaxID=2576037 RepID=UPI003BAA55B4
MNFILKGITFFILLTNVLFAVSWDTCIEKYSKAKKFSDNTKLMYIYLKSTKNCLLKLKESLKENPKSEFTLEAMDNNIKKINGYMEELIPNYIYPNSNLEQIPKYIYNQQSIPKFNTDYIHFIKFEKCNGIHAEDKIYTAKHCNIENSMHIKNDLSYIKTNTISKLETNKLDLNKSGTFKYYSMSKEGMFYNVLIKEKDCKFYEEKVGISAITQSLDLADLNKKTEIRSNCLAIPSNSGGGVFQDNKLVGIISKTVFKNDIFLYSVIEPIHTVYK